MVKAMAAEAEAKVKVKAMEAVNVALKAMEVTVVVVEAEPEAVWRRCRGGECRVAATAAASGGSEIFSKASWPDSLSRISSPGARPRVKPFSSA